MVIKKNPDFYQDQDSENSLGPVPNTDLIFDSMGLKTAPKQSGRHYRGRFYILFYG
jgi:hypothetical protein